MLEFGTSIGTEVKVNVYSSVDMNPVPDGAKQRNKTNFGPTLTVYVSTMIFPEIVADRLQSTAQIMKIGPYTHHVILTC